MTVFVFAAVGGDPTSWAWLTQGGAIGVMAAVLIGLVRGWLVPGKQYEEVCEQRDKALDQVYKLADGAIRSIEAVERKIQ